MTARIIALFIVAATSLNFSAQANERSGLVQRIKANAKTMQRYVDLLNSPKQAIRLAALSEMGKSTDPAIAELAIETGFSSDDPAMAAIAIRAAFRQVRSIVANVKRPKSPNAKQREVLKLCGDGVQYTIEEYNYRTGHFEVRGQDQTGVGNISGTTLSLTIEYGCSLTGVLQRDGIFTGMVSAPYRKGTLPAKFAYR